MQKMLYISPHLPTRFLACFLIFTASFFKLSSVRADAQGVGDLLIAPTRLVMTSVNRTAEVNLINVGSQQATYRISLIHERMMPDGTLAEIQGLGPNEQFADDLIRFTPRQVVLDPHSSQLVRVDLRLPAELAAGEYRSHLLFRAVPAASPSTDPADNGDSSQGLSIKITPIYGVSIPVIVRSGDTSASVSISNLALVLGADDIPTLSGELDRSGNCSVYGNMQVEFATSRNHYVTIGRMAGVAIYSPNLNRTFTMRLAPPRGVQITGGTIRTSYVQTAEDGGSQLAESTLAVP
jgi:hypothetical protein